MLYDIKPFPPICKHYKIEEKEEERSLETVTVAVFNQEKETMKLFMLMY